jgi:hypothetical protein
MLPFGEQGTPPAGNNAAIAFLRRHGHASLVSLGRGPELKRLDNHLRLFIALNLTYYVGIDCVPAPTLLGRLPRCLWTRKGWAASEFRRRGGGEQQVAAAVAPRRARSRLKEAVSSQQTFQDNLAPAPPGLSKSGKNRWGGPPAPPEPWAAGDSRPIR